MYVGRLGSYYYFKGAVAEVAYVREVMSSDEVARWHAGMLDLRAYGSGLTWWDWCGDGVDTPSVGLSHGPGGNSTSWINMTAADIVEA